MSNKMIERVAKAIELRDTTDSHAMARAAIEAMRKPTKEMIEFADSVSSDGRGSEDAWISMIMVALDER